MSRSPSQESEPATDKSLENNPALTPSKTYDPSFQEPRWQEYWKEIDLYRFDPNDVSRSTYSIDTPPPYPSGEFHVGNALNWSYIDFVARYKRMRGFNVHFPQGWDCHGLPTEVRAERTFKIRKNDVPPAKFIEICRNLSDEYISKMRETITRLGISTDWKLEYKTMNPEYYKLTQLSFIILFKSGHMYKGEHPVNWCPRDETAIAEAEVVYVERKGSLHFMRFGDKGNQLEIASTRPELLGACVAVAVHPEDDRYKSLVGKSTTVPVFGQKVPVIADEDVDPRFGTGAVMVCTYGDKMDVKWQKKYNLPVIKEIGENGRIVLDDRRFNGLRIEDARKKTIEELNNSGQLIRTEPVKQNVGTCWRCNTPVEILARPQWFMKTREMTRDVIDSVDRLHWVPAFGKQRLVDWTMSLDWDWVISRQRIFGTPIPVWTCQQCGEIVMANDNQLPIDPRIDPPPTEACPKCGSQGLKGDSDVFDTWMDSSITSAVHAGWPLNKSQFDRLFPADLQPNGLDIVRTWDYYLLVRSLALFQKPPYKTLLINGMVRGTDGRMMHKSYGNAVETGEVIKKLGADSFRQWAASGGATGYDIPFRWNDAEYGKKFLTKLWNVTRFVQANAPKARDPYISKLSAVDQWLLSSAQRLIETVTNAFENFQFNAAIEAIRDFTWHLFADDYIESAKYRLQPGWNNEDSETAKLCLKQTLLTVCKLLSPICPHITEAIYHKIEIAPNNQSIHLQKWPEPEAQGLEPGRVEDGRLILATIAEARRRKAEKGLSLKSPIKQLVITSTTSEKTRLQANQDPILRTIKADSLSFQEVPGKEHSKSAIQIEIVV